MARKKQFARRFAHVAQYTQEDNATFNELFQNLEDPKAKENQIVPGYVVKIEGDTVVVDVGLKNEGRIPLNEFKYGPDATLPVVGDSVDVYVARVDGRYGRTVVSREEAYKATVWQKLVQSFEKGELVSGLITSKTKGGFIVDLSRVTAFLPASQLDIRPVKDYTFLTQGPLNFKILKMDETQKNIVVSRRAVLEESRAIAKAETLEKISENMVLKGIVKNITDYGAFIDLGHLDALLHITDISYKRISHPSEILKLGQEIEVIVTKIDKDNQRLHVGLKQLSPNPWENIDAEFKVGQIITGKIVALSDHNIFVEPVDKEGIEGVVPYTEISWGKLEASPKRLFTIDQEIQCIITSIEKDKPKMMLSIKKCSLSPWQKFADEHPVGTVITRTIRNITDFGIFVALDQHIDGMIHSTDLSWKGKGEELLKEYKKGDEITCKILSVDLEKERISLGIKQLTDDPYENQYNEYQIGDVVDCEVTAMGAHESLKVKLKNDLPAVIKKSELSASKAHQKVEGYKEGDILTVKVINVDRTARQIYLSLKAMSADSDKSTEDEQNN